MHAFHPPEPTAIVQGYEAALAKGPLLTKSVTSLAGFVVADAVVQLVSFEACARCACIDATLINEVTCCNMPGSNCHQYYAFCGLKRVGIYCKSTWGSDNSFNLSRNNDGCANGILIHRSLINRRMMQTRPIMHGILGAPCGLGSLDFSFSAR